MFYYLLDFLLFILSIFCLRLGYLVCFFIMNSLIVSINSMMLRLRFTLISYLFFYIVSFIDNLHTFILMFLHLFIFVRYILIVLTFVLIAIITNIIHILLFIELQGCILKRTLQGYL